MKKYIDPAIPGGGLQMFAADMLGCFQNEIYRAIIAPYLQYGEALIINGCTVAADTVHNTCTITAGMAFIDGDLIDVPAYAGAYPVYLHQGAPIVTQKAYRDQSVHDVTIQKTTAFVNAAPGAGQYITFDPYTSQYLRDVHRRYETPVNAMIPFLDLPSNFATYFDALTGVGKWRWKGFKVPPELSGKVLAQYNPADLDALNSFAAIANTPGAKTKTLSTNEMPAGVRVNGEDSTYLETAPPATGKTTKNTFAGGGQAFGIVQPTYVGLYLVRIAV